MHGFPHPWGLEAPGAGLADESRMEMRPEEVPCPATVPKKGLVGLLSTT